MGKTFFCWPLVASWLVASGSWLNRFIRHSEKTINQEPVTSSQRPGAINQQQVARDNYKEFVEVKIKYAALKQL
jgi:hypothetical protein